MAFETGRTAPGWRACCWCASWIKFNRSIATAFRTFHPAAVVPFDGGRDRTAVLQPPRADDDTPRADPNVNTLIPPNATASLISVATDLNIDLGHLDIFGLGRDGPDEQRGSRQNGRGGRHGKRDLRHAVFLSGLNTST